MCSRPWHASCRGHHAQCAPICELFRRSLLHPCFLAQSYLSITTTEICHLYLSARMPSAELMDSVGPHGSLGRLTTHDLPDGLCLVLRTSRRMTASCVLLHTLICVNPADLLFLHDAPYRYWIVEHSELFQELEPPPLSNSAAGASMEQLPPLSDDKWPWSTAIFAARTEQMRSRYTRVSGGLSSFIP